MTIQDIIRESVKALYTSQPIASRFVLKGGAALSISENLQNRLSKDIDFSVEGRIDSPGTLFSKAEAALRKHFLDLNYELFDFKYSKRPKTLPKEMESFWGGYSIQFKLINKGHAFVEKEQIRKNAYLPGGADSTNITLEVSEFEYCGIPRQTIVDNVVVSVYGPEFLVLEKLRAICQQHPMYEYRGKYARNRSRDFYDIYQLVRKHRSNKFYDALSGSLRDVFNAKKVPVEIIQKIFEKEFIEVQRNGFEEVKKAVVSGKSRLEDFEFYVEQLKFLVRKLSV